MHCHCYVGQSNQNGWILALLVGSPVVGHNVGNVSLKPAHLDVRAASVRYLPVAGCRCWRNWCIPPSSDGTPHGCSSAAATWLRQSLLTSSATSWASRIWTGCQVSGLG